MSAEESQVLAAQDLPLAGADESGHGHPYPTRRSMSAQNLADSAILSPSEKAQAKPIMSLEGGYLPSPTSGTPKNVSFELHFDGAPNVRGRLPIRVQIFPHDTIDAIVTTVKNFFGLYEGVASGVSFEDTQGRNLVASYDNLSNNMIVRVRVVPEATPVKGEVPLQWAGPAIRPGSPIQRLPPMEESISLLPQPAQILSYGQPLPPPSRPHSRLSRKQSASPKMPQKSRSRSGVKSSSASFQAGLDELNNEALTGYTTSDGGAGSVDGSRKGRSELATAEISVENIVEGGRRQRAKFESSELPLFVPPQVPAPNSLSSASPQRRSTGVDNISPFARPIQRNFAFPTPLQMSPNGIQESPMGAPQAANGFTIPPVPNHRHHLRDRSSGASLSARSSLGSNGRAYGANVLPTPDPTVASCISDEDVALQLMRLGDASNFSHGRTSASTLDDSFSGRAEVASSVTDDSDTENTDADEHYDNDTDRGLPPAKRFKKSGENGVISYESVEGDYDEDYESRGTIRVRTKPGPRPKKSRTNSTSSRSKPGKALKKGKHSSGSTPTAQSRKASSSSVRDQQLQQLGTDEEDLSSKPRCQRCRKSKKGCDRQRPCGRCKDAGIGIEGCVSEDEGNGRKGRYGRHMGVTVKKAMPSAPASTVSASADGDVAMGEARRPPLPESLQLKPSIEGMAIDSESASAGAILSEMMASAGNSPDKMGKKRKR